MDKTVMGLVAAIGATIPFASAQAAVVSSDDAASVLRVASVADLLEPVPNSAAILAALDSERKPAPAPAVAEVKGLKVAQWHHHHHHHHWHHHHHHHYYYHHHHHWHRPGCVRTPVGWVCP